MKFKIQKTYDPKKVEDRIYNLWLKSGFFSPDKLPGKRKKTYTIMLPPPNVTGSLHIGHALNAVVQDVLIRFKRMQGFKTLWLPGTDHAGIATQNVVEKELKKEGLTKFDLGREKFLERVWQWKKKYGNIILDQFKSLGCSLDWSRTVFTMDSDYAKAVETTFFYYYKKGWIYKGVRPINWCKRCQTSLSDLELEYKEEKGKLWYIRYSLKVKSQKSKVKSYIVVATTRPETMLGDSAVAVNPRDERYKKLIGKITILPLVGRELPIVQDSLVDPKFGTGAVKITPAHDLVDYDIGMRHKLAIIKVIDEAGKITNLAPEKYRGLTVLEAREKVLQDLQNQGLVEKEKAHLPRVPRCYRCNTIVEVIPSEQWFLKMDVLAKKAMKAVESSKIKFVPKRFEKIYFDWLKSVKDWCISRQIWWGHTLPIWYCQIGKKSKVKNRASIYGSEGEEEDEVLFACQKSKVNNEYFISLQEPKECPICGKCKPKQISDVLDTWFSSALWPFATLGWPKKTKDLKIYYPTDVLSTARDIINLWVARMVFSGLELLKKIPFQTVYVHPTILTKEGKRMSKSLGTGIDPMVLIAKYGADAVRVGLTWQLRGGQDIRFSEDAILMGKKFCNKIWNASRFVLMNKSSRINTNFGSLRSPHGFPRIKNLTSADKRILKALNRTIKSVNRDLENFRFGQAAETLYNFFWHDFCDRYIEESKKQNNLKTKKILFYVLLTSLRLLHPFLPFITEEIYQKLPLKKKKRYLMLEIWPV